MNREFKSDVAFTPAVKAEQERRGSRSGYQKMAEKHDWNSTVTPELSAFVTESNSFYLGTATKHGQPYIQHRGGPKGFLKVIDNKTLGFADYYGNRQYVSIGNLAENDKAYMFLMDYENRRRVKIWGRVRVVEGDGKLIDELMVSNYKARPERVFLFEIEAWDTNCPQHIPRKIDFETVEQATAKLTRRIEELEAQIASLQQAAP